MLKRTLCATLGLLLSASLTWAGSTAVTGEEVYPSQNDLYGAGVGGSAGDGKKLLEKQWRKIAGPLNGQNNYLLTGGALPATDPDLTISIEAGSAVLEGHFVHWPATNVTLPASNTSHLFLKLVFGGDLVTGVEIEDNTSDTPPAASTKLGTATTSVSAVTGTTDQRILGPGAATELTGGTAFAWPAGVNRIFVEVYGASGGGGGGANTAGDGTDGTAGGTTTFGPFTANGGGAGKKGTTPIPDTAGAIAADHGTASGGSINRTGGGMTGGHGGAAGSGGGTTGSDGGHGGYCAGWITSTPGSITSYSIGAAGIKGNGPNSAHDGKDGFAGRIVITY